MTDYLLAVFVAFLLLKAFNACGYALARHVEDHTNFTTGHTKFKERLSAALWWLA